MRLISIVIPVYKVEKYLEKCLDSCINQDLSSNQYEIIVINDGSPDNSLSIAKKYEEKYSHIHVYSQENSGLSIARNKGLSYAKGKFVWFVDSDDCIRENCLKEIVEQCDRENLDLLAICGARVISGSEVRRFSYTDLTVISGIMVLNQRRNIPYPVQFSIFKRAFLLEHNLSFYPGVYHEDTEFSPRAYFYAKRVGFTNDILYLTTINPNSITRTVNPKKSFDYIKVAISIHGFANDKTKRLCEQFFHNHISLLINNALANIIQSDSKENVSIIKQFSKCLHDNRYLLVHLCRSSKLKYKIEGVLFSLFPHYIVNIYKLLVISVRKRT